MRSTSENLKQGPQRHNRKQPAQSGHRKYLPARECQDEGEEINRKRDDPKQRHAGDVGCQVSSDAEHQTRGHERESQPTQSPSLRTDLPLTAPRRTTAPARVVRGAVSLFRATPTVSPCQAGTAQDASGQEQIATG